MTDPVPLSADEEATYRRFASRGPGSSIRFTPLEVARIFATLDARATPRESDGVQGDGLPRDSQAVFALGYEDGWKDGETHARVLAAPVAPDSPDPLRDIAAEVWRDHYLGGDEDHPLGPLDDTDRKDADAVIEELARRGVALRSVSADSTAEVPTIDCLCGDVFPSVEAFHEHIHLSHPEADIEGEVSADSTAGLDVERLARVFFTTNIVGIVFMPEARRLAERIAREYAASPAEEPDAGVHDRNLLDEDTGETAIDARARAR